MPASVSAKTFLRAHPTGSTISLSFGLPLRNSADVNALIQREAKTHRYLSRAQLYARFSPSAAQYNALSRWLVSKGFRITHVGVDRLALTASATTARVEQALHVQINDYLHASSTYQSVKVAPYLFYANTTAPLVPARLGLQSISGLTDVDRFFTQAQLDKANAGAPTRSNGKRLTPGGADCSDPDDVADGEAPPVSPLCVDTRSGGYFPSDIKSMYDVSGHGFDGTGQTLGFTLWGAGERQAAMTAFATATGDQLITVDPPCVATGNSPSTPSSCTTATVAGDHLLSILENGNTNNQFGGNVETALDIEQAHGIATHAGMKYYLADCTNGVPPGSGLTNGSNCNGTDVGMEEAIEDAANDPTLHSVSNSWAFGGEAEMGLADPFLIASENSFKIAALAGTTFYFSTGDSGTYQSGYPSDSQYVVAVGGTTLFSTNSPSTLSTEDTWAAGGSWCSNIIVRPSWQTGAGVTANAPCPGRVIPDVSAVADTNSAVKVVASTNATGGTTSGSVGGTSVAAPEMNGLEAVTESFIAAQTYPGAKPAIGFEAPMIYSLGNSNSDAYFRDVLCGNTASPSGGPDGDSAQPGWDSATGWGAPDWFHFATGYAIALGAEGLSTPSSLSQNYSWTCAKTPGNSSERSIAFPSSSVGFAVGAASGGTPWYAKFLTTGSWGAVNTFYKTTDGGKTWFPSNGDMTSIACTSASSCVEVGDGGRIKTTSNGGSTWADTATPFDKGLTQVQCPSSTICYAAGDRGTVLKSTDGGTTWSYLQSTDGNPVYGLTCPTTSVCYATDIYAHIIKTSDGGSTWTWQSTPVTTPGLEVPGSGGPNPFAGLFGISCVSATSCVAVGGFPPSGTDPPIVATTDGGSTWTLETSNAGANNYLASVSCLAGTTTCYAVGRGGAIVMTTNMLTWTKVTSGVTTMLNSITCLSTTSCLASGQGGTVDTMSGGVWTPKTGLGGGVFLASITCLSSTACYTAGKQGVTLATTDGGVTWAQQAGGGTTQQMNGVSCPSTSTCFAVGNAGTILATTNGGQTWLPQVSGTTSALNSVSCTSATNCVAVGAAGTVRTTVDGSTWVAGVSGTTQALNGVSCTSATACVAAGAAGTILTTSTGGMTWSVSASGTTLALTAVACTTGACYATGAVTAGNAVMLKSTDGGVTWAAETSSSGQALTGIACLDASNCFAGGGIGTVVQTVNGGATWTQIGNPISGPTSALNAGPTSITAINGAACSSARCFMATASSGNIMTTPLLIVTVKTTSAYGTTPPVSGLAPNNAAISYSPSSEAGNVTGTLTCTTTATSTSDPGVFPISNCSGLSDSGFSVVYDYADSSETVIKANQTITFGALPNKTVGDADFTVAATSTSGLTVAFAAAGSCTMANATTVHLTGVGTCTITASQPGNIDYNAAPSVPQSFYVASALAFNQQAMEGDMKLAPGTTITAGYDFTMPGQHAAATLTFVEAHMTFTWTCVSGPGSGSFTLSIPDMTYTDPAGSSNWYPTDNQQTASVYQGSTTVPNVCNGGLVRFQQGASFLTGVMSNDTRDDVHVRWHYSANGSSGGWSGTSSIKPQ